MKKALVIVCVLCVVAIGLSVAAIALVAPNLNKTQTEPAFDTQYVLYLGTNDKDTNLPVFSHEQAKVKAEEILIKHFGGYTIQEADGGWIDEGTTYQEYTLVIYLSDTTLDKVHLAAKEMLQVFNQSSVLIQSNQTVTEFYAGD